MSLPNLFRVSLYLALGLSTLALGYASQVQLPALDVLYCLLALLILASYLLQDRWQLTNRQSNMLGLVIAAVAGVGYYLQRDPGAAPTQDDIFATLLPWAGVLLGILLLAKLFRPKHAGDYWTIHAIALMQVILACVLAMSNKLDRDAPWFPAMLVAYLLSMVWALRNLTLYHDAVLIRRSTGETITELHHRAPHASIGFGATLSWYLLVMAAGLTAFFILPRGRSQVQSLFGAAPQAQTGYNSNLDLNAQGEVETSEELVFEAEVRNPIGQVVQLPTEGHRWRGDTCTDYLDGRWRRTRSDMITFDRNHAEARQPGYFRIHVRMDVGRVPESENSGITSSHPSEVPLFTLDPYAFSERGSLPTTLSPRVTLADHELEPQDIDFRRSIGESLLHVTGLKRRTKKLMYYQYVPAISDHDSWDQLLPVTQSQLEDYRFYRRLRELPEQVRNGRIPQETTGILQRLRQESKLATNAGPADIAGALEQFLAFSGEYTYNLNRQRQDLTIDPTEDFLCNVKSGHCARYASALALMLRSQGIPSRIVLGFRGDVWNNLTGMHEVRGIHAHAWVEALVNQKQETYLDRRTGMLAQRMRLTWRVLDPTPTLETGANRRDFLTNNLNLARSLWEFFILDFSGPQQRRKLREFFTFLGVDALVEWWKNLSWTDIALIGFCLAGFIVLLFFYGRRFLRYLSRLWARMRGKLPPEQITVPFFLQLQRLLQRYYGPRQLPHTPAEFASLLAPQMEKSAATAPVAYVPMEIVDQYYAVRFGQTPLTPELAERMKLKLEALELALRNRG